MNSSLEQASEVYEKHLNKQREESKRNSSLELASGE